MDAIKILSVLAALVAGWWLGSNLSFGPAVAVVVGLMLVSLTCWCLAGPVPGSDRDG